MFLNPLNAEWNSICHLLVLLGAHPILHISRIRVKNRDLDMRFEGFTTVTEMYIIMNVIPRGMEEIYWHSGVCAGDMAGKNEL